MWLTCVDRSGNVSKLNKFAPPTSGGKFAHLCSSFPILSLSEVDRLDWLPFSMLLGSERASDRAGVSYRSRLCHPPQGGLSSRSLHLGWGGGGFLELTISKVQEISGTAEKIDTFLTFLQVVTS